MNQYIIGTAVLLVVLLSIGNVSAEMYEASIDTYEVMLYENGTIESSLVKDENLWIGQGETVTVFDGIEIEF